MSYLVKQTCIFFAAGLLKYLKGINFHEFRKFSMISRKLVPAKIISDCATREIREN